MLHMARGFRNIVFSVIIFSFFTTLLLIPVGTAGAEALNYRLKWLYNASVIGDIYALDRGLFEKNGLEVNVKEGGPERNAIRELEMGHAQFGVASADQVIRAIEKGSPVVVIAQLFQINPLHWIYRSQNWKIKSLSDLKGKIIGVTFGGNDDNVMQALLEKSQLNKNEYTLYSVRRDLTPFYKKKADIWPCYLNSQGVILKKKLGKEGEAVAFLNPADFDIKFVANSVVTSVRMIEEQPETVKKFIASLMAGWRESLDPSNESKALETLKKFDKGATADLQKDQLDATRPLVKPSADTKIGMIDVDAWKQTEQIMLKGKQIAKPIGVERALKPYPEAYQ
jgi:NitT/TauT family transport system substrate-binding protein